MTSTNWPTNLSIEQSFQTKTSSETDRQRQAAHDKQVVREILAGCRQERRRQRRSALRARIPALLKALTLPDA